MVLAAVRAVIRTLKTQRGIENKWNNFNYLGYVYILIKMHIRGVFFIDKLIHFATWYGSY